MYKTNVDLSGKLLVDKNMIEGVVTTLKKLKVKGFDSMDRLVGAVMVLESYLDQEAPICEEIQEYNPPDEDNCTSVPRLDNEEVEEDG